MEVCVSPSEFNEALWKRFKLGKIRNVYPLAKYNDIIEKIKTIEDNPPCNTPGEYYLLRKFIVVNVGGKERLSCKSENNPVAENIHDASVLKVKFYIALEEIYNFLDEAHKSVKHGGRDRILRSIQNQGIVNITRDTVELFLSFCKICRPRKKDFPRRLVAKTVSQPAYENDQSCDSPTNNFIGESENTDRLAITSDRRVTEGVKFELDQNRNFGTVCSFTRGYVDLIDLSSTPDGDFRFVFLYLDLQTCFSVLQPVRCKCSHEIVSHLLNIFTLLGPPQILHSSFNDQFLSTVVREIKQDWPDIVIVSATECYQEVQEVAQNCISEIKSLLNVWMTENNSSRWSFGLKFTQLRKNTKLNGVNTKSPYECFFGRPMDTSKLLPCIDSSLLKKAQKEDDLLNIINQQNETESSSYESLQVSVDPKICNLVQNHIQELPELDSSQIIESSIIKVEPESDECVNGFTLSDSSNDLCFSPKTGNLEIVIKQEANDSS